MLCQGCVPKQATCEIKTSFYHIVKSWNIAIKDFQQVTLASTILQWIKLNPLWIIVDSSHLAYKDYG